MLQLCNHSSHNETQIPRLNSQMVPAETNPSLGNQTSPARHRHGEVRNAALGTGTTDATRLEMFNGGFMRNGGIAGTMPLEQKHCCLITRALNKTLTELNINITVNAAQ